VAKAADGVPPAKDGVRYIVVAQRRRTTDVPFSRVGDAINKLLGREGYTVYILFGKSLESEDYQLMTGPCIELTTSEYSNLAKDLEPLRKTTLSDEEFGNLFDTLAAKFTNVSDKPGCGISAIELSRDGKIEIAFNDIEDQEAQDVASQIYFFVRDVCHVHQHHAPTSDTILDVVPHSVGEHHWKRETLYSLYRWVIQQKRSKSPSAYVDAKGVLAYARAFTEKHCHSEEHSKCLPQYLRDATIESLDAGLARAEYLEKTKGKFPATLFNRILPSIGLVLAFLTPFYRSPGATGATDQEILVARFADWINDNIINVSAALIFTIVIANVAIVFRSRIFSWRPWFDLFRTLFPVPYWLVVFVLTIASASFVVLAAEGFWELTTIPYDPAP
jgi:hypothetical protein